MKKIKKYKVLNKNFESPFQNFPYEIGKEYCCKNFDENKKEDCSIGFYATDLEGLSYSYNINNDIYLCEVWGKSVIYNQFKQRFEHIKLLKKVTPTFIKKEIVKEDLKNKLGYDLEKALFPTNPLLIKRGKVTKEEIKLLKQWINVKDSVVFGGVRRSISESVGESDWGSVESSVFESIRDSVWQGIRHGIRHGIQYGVWESVEDILYAYLSSIFFGVKKWKGVEYKEGKNPFQSGIDLWNRGLVPSFDGKTWRLLHNGINAKIVYERGSFYTPPK